MKALKREHVSSYLFLEHSYLNIVVICRNLYCSVHWVLLLIFLHFNSCQPAWLQDIQGTRTTAYRYREKKFVKFFDTHDEMRLVCCKSITGLLMTALGISSDINIDWWCEKQKIDGFFIDGSVSSLKAVLLLVGYKRSGVSVGCSNMVKESYYTFKMLLSLIK